EELHLVHDFSRTTEAIRLAEVCRVAIITRARSVRAAARRDHRHGVLTGRHRGAVHPLRLPVQVADRVELVDLVLGPARAERPRKSIEALLARRHRRSAPVVAGGPGARAALVTV